jgi:Zn-dependent peptidase ImmA (M78 family)
VDAVNTPLMRRLEEYLRSLTSEQLAALSAKSSIENTLLLAIAAGNREPGYQELDGLSNALALPVSYLLSQVKDNDRLNLLFRKTGAADPLVEHRLRRFAEGVLALNPDRSAAIDFRGKIPPTLENYEQAELQAEFFRRFFCDNDLVNPLSSLPTILSDQLGVVVRVTELGKSSDGASAVIDGLPFIFLAPRFAPRMLFTLAHELGHLISHHGGDDYVLIDKSVTGLNRSSNGNSEHYVNAFASALLMPAQGVGITLKEFRERNNMLDKAMGDIDVVYLSRLFNVSFDVAAQRCEALTLIQRGGALSLSKAVKESFGSAEKHAEALGFPPRDEINFPLYPKYVLNRASELVASGEMSIGKISELLGVSQVALNDQNQGVA